jgi:hypothetical protein
LESVTSVLVPTNSAKTKLRPFLGYFLDALEQLAEEGYFAQLCGDACSDELLFGWWQGAVCRKLALYSDGLEWPIETERLRKLTDEDIRAYVEIFYHLVSKPIDLEFHRHCGNSHATEYNERDGHFEYTKRVNALFSKHAPEYRLTYGRVNASGSKILSPRMADTLAYQGDSHLERLVESGVRKFRSGQESERLSALTDMANALERIKTTLGDGDKRDSISLLIERLSPDSVLNDQFNVLIMAITKLSNQMTIRHHERDKIALTGQDDLIEYLFFSYYNTIRFALARLAT